MKKLLIVLGLAVLALIAILLINTWRATPGTAPRAAQSLEPVDEAALAQRLSAAIAIATLSPTEPAPSLQAFAQLRAQLEADFPLLHAALTHELIGGASLLYHWAGSDPDCAPTLLLAHQDVVPVEPGTEADWTHPPFSGAIADGFVWGRGAIDDKSMLLASMEAVESLLQSGYRPRCSIYLAYGHDEEVGGEQGARAIAARLQTLGVKPAFVLDEGGALTLGVVPGVALPVATIGVAEKGYVSVRLTAHGEGGHSSMPPQHSAIGLLAGAVARLEAQHPAAELGPVQRELLRRLAPHMALAQRVVMSNLWLTAPLIKSIFAAAPATDATQRTTTAPTIFQAGVKDNVLPQQAEAVVNFRIRPGDSIAGVLAHVRTVVANPGIDISANDGFASEPTTPAAWDNEPFARIERALREVSAEATLVVAPYVTTGGTDARHYAALTPNLYRVGAVLMRPDDLKRIHGSNERIGIAEYARTVRFYLNLLRGLDRGNAG
jgi:carboxypeptidase PM20D1